MDRRKNVFHGEHKCLINTPAYPFDAVIKYFHRSSINIFAFISCKLFFSDSRECIFGSIDAMLLHSIFINHFVLLLLPDETRYQRKAIHSESLNILHIPVKRKKS